MNSPDRRRFLKRSLLGTAALSLPSGSSLAARAADPASRTAGPPGIVDTNVNLFDWPFRRLKYSQTRDLVAKLEKHRIIEAWAGSFEALLHKDMEGVNRRLAAECRTHGGGILRPFGSINLAWPDWEEDVRRCHEVYRMPGLRIYPGYQPFDLDHPGVGPLVRMAAERGLVLQVVFGMEDPRVHHPILNVGRATVGPLIDIIKEAPTARVTLLHFTGSARGNDLHNLMTQTSACLDLSRLEGNGAVGRLIGTAPGSTQVRVPVDRLLFGSHVPYFPLETAILKLIESPLDQQQLFAIMQGNARRLLPRT